MYGYACAQIFRRARLIKDTHMTIVICAAFAIPLSFAKRRLQHSAVVMAMVENAVCKKIPPFSSSVIHLLSTSFMSNKNKICYIIFGCKFLWFLSFMPYITFFWQFNIDDVCQKRIFSEDGLFQRNLYYIVCLKKTGDGSDKSHPNQS